MKKSILILISLLIFNTMTDAQQNNPVGSYYLHGVMEMASGFNLKPDSSFEFFFSYGALDRYGKGTWKQKGDKIIFNSLPRPGNDFKLTGSSKTSDAFIHIKVNAKDSLFNNYVYASGNLKEGEYPVKANSAGDINLPVVDDTIRLYFEFVPERISVFTVDTKRYNNFTFEFEPWIMEVFFSDFNLTLGNKKLTGAHPLITKEDCEYSKGE
jgi:hypothetical protein